MPTPSPLLSPAQVALVQSGWAALRPHASDVADLFFRRLFERLPATRASFGGAMLPHARERWVALVGLAIEVLGHLEEGDGGLLVASASFRPLCVIAEDIDTLGEIFVGTIADALDHECDESGRIAWARAYSVVLERIRAYAAPQPDQLSHSASS